MASEMLSKVLDAENSDKEAQKAAHEQAQKTVDAAVEAGEGAVARKKAEAAKKAEEIIAGAREQARANEELKRRQGSASAKCLRLPKRTEPRQSERLWRR